MSASRSRFAALAVAVRAAARPAIAANLLAALALCVLSISPAAAAATATGKWTFNMYDSRAVRYQDPDYTACTAASTMMALNMASYRATQDGFMSSSAAVYAPMAYQASMHWRPDISYARQTAILAYERANMTMLLTSRGTDPHGWRNALNYFGWGSNGAGIYRDESYSTFDAAARAVVTSLARYQKVVGILGIAGTHAQIVTGYIVTGEDPRISDNFQIAGIYLTDPLRSQAMRNAFISLANWRAGPIKSRFTKYTQSDSPYQDPIDGHVGYAEWFGRWVILDPAQ